MNRPPYFRSLAVLASATLLCCGFAIAQNRMPPSPGEMQQQTPGSQASQMQEQMQNQQQASPLDREFLREAMEGNLAEVELGNLALKKSSDAQVKQFAQRMIDDHTKMNGVMESIARKTDVPAPEKPGKKARKTQTRLAALSGADFDRAYVEDMIEDHKHDLRAFQQESISGQSPAIQHVASQGATIINQHLQMIEQIAKDKNIPAKGPKG